MTKLPMDRHTATAAAIPFAAGAVTFILLHVLFTATWETLWGGHANPFVTNSMAAIGFTMAVLFLVALTAGLAAPRSAPRRWVAACGLWSGVILATIVILFLVGPGNLWPFVIALATAAFSVAMVPGFLLGSWLVERRSRSTGR